MVMVVIIIRKINILNIKVKDYTLIFNHFIKNLNKVI